MCMNSAVKICFPAKRLDANLILILKAEKSLFTVDSYKPISLLDVDSKIS